MITETKLERQITFGNWDELNQATNDLYTSEIPREIAYIWAGPDAVANVFPSQAAYWGGWLQLSGWQTERPDPVTFFEVSGDNQWWYLKTSKFATEYGKHNPDADFGTTWKLYFQEDSELEQARLVNKIRKVDDLFTMLEIF